MTRRAKFTPPDTQGLIDRPALVRRLLRRGSGPVTWIVGPPGAGKTSLAVNVLRRWEGDCFWFQLDAGDGDPAVLFENLVEAFRLSSRRRTPALPGFSPAWEASLPVHARAFFERGYARFKGPTLVVLDNIQDLPSDSSSLAALLEGLEVLPPGFRVLALSRQTPPPGCARLEASGKLDVMVWEELKMCGEEARALLRQRMPRDSGQERLADLCRLADGWPAGLVLMASEAKRLPLSGADGLSREVLFDFFACEVLQRARPEVRELLLGSSAFPSFTADQARELTGLSSAEASLRMLARSGHFTTAHGHPHPVYEFHPLFREFLHRQAAQALGPEAWRDLRQRAAHMLAQEGRVLEAYEGYRDAGAFDAQAHLIRTQAASMLERGQHQTLLAWLEALPAEVTGSDPWLRLWLGTGLMGQDPPASHRHLEQAFEAFGRAGDVAGQMMAWCAVVDSWLYAWDDYSSLDRWIEWMDGHLETFTGLEDPRLRDMVAISMTWAIAHRRPTHRDAADWVRRAEEILREGVHPQARLRAGTAAFMFRFWAGEHAACQLLARDMHRLAQALHEPMALITSYWAEAGILIWNGTDLERCRTLIEAGLEEGRKQGIHLLDFMFHGHAVSLALMEGDQDRARRALEAMEAVVHGQNSRSFLHYLSGWEAFVSGRLPAAIAHAKAAVDCSERSGMPSTEALNRMALADLLHEAGQEEASREQARLAEAQVALTGSPIIEMMFHQGMARRSARRGRLEDAGRAHLARAFTLGRSHGLVQALWQVPAWTSQLCLLALEHGIEADFARHVIRVQGLAPSVPPLACPQWPWPLRVTTLGRFAIARDGQEFLFPAKAPRTVLLLFKAIIAAGPSGIPESRLCDWIWPEADGDAARGSLDTTLHRLRKLLGVEGAVILREGRLEIDPAHCWVDAHGFEILLEQPMEGLREKALALYHGAFLEDLDEPWARSCRDSLQEKYLKAVLAQGRQLEDRSDFPSAIACYEGGLEAVPLSEELYRRLMTVHGANGHPTEAMRIYARCRSVLRGGLDMEPSRDTELLAHKVRTEAGRARG